MSCPNCKSNDWKMASVIYAEGLSGISTSTVGLGVGTGGLGAGVAGTTGNQQSVLSKLAAPPTLPKSENGWLIALLGIIGATFGTSITEDSGMTMIFIFSGLVLVVLGINVILNRKPARVKYQKDLLEYKNKKMCLRCGTFFFDDCEILSPSVVAIPIVVESLNSSDMKKCPFCAEEVKADAIRCKHCRSDI